MLREQALQRLTTLPSWVNLIKIRQSQPYDLRTKSRQYECFTIRQSGVTLDFDLQFLTSVARESLFNLAIESKLTQKIDALFTAEKLNFSENRAVLHTALRAPFEQNIVDVGSEVADNIQQAFAKMAEVANCIRQRQWFGYTGKPIKYIINIGIGGSDLGPRMGVEALQDFADLSLKYFFISDADPLSFEQVCKHIDIETSLFIVVSKSFSTRETLINAKKAMALYSDCEYLDKHFIAVTSDLGKAQLFGIQTILPIWDWLGGRFSFCSAVNLILMIAIGETYFRQMLQGAHEMDIHFRTCALENNMPVMLGLLSILNVNVRDIHTHSILVYNNRLKYFPDFLQQLEMESNGKSLNLWGEKITYKTSPIVWGAIGNRAQHAYYQLLVQGTQKISLDFIFDSMHTEELVDAYGQNIIKTLSKGKSTNDWSHIEGKQPLNKITLDKISPYCLGSLIALYEHKIFVQGIIWQINSFDQFGVESAKLL